MVGLTAGELGLTAFIVVAILTARYFPRLGERIVLGVAAGRDARGAEHDEKP